MAHFVIELNYMYTWRMGMQLGGSQIRTSAANFKAYPDIPMSRVKLATMNE